MPKAPEVPIVLQMCEVKTVSEIPAHHTTRIHPLLQAIERRLVLELTLIVCQSFPPYLLSEIEILNLIVWSIGHQTQPIIP